MPDSPTARTLKELRADGWRVDVVERWNGHSRTRHDFCGFGDLIAYKGQDTLAVQATSTPNMGARFNKVRDDPELAKAVIDWLEGERRFFSIVGWKKYAKRVDGKLWRPTWRPVEMRELLNGEATDG